MSRCDNQRHHKGFVLFGSNNIIDGFKQKDEEIGGQNFPLAVCENWRPEKKKAAAQKETVVADPFGDDDTVN